MEGNVDIFLDRVKTLQWVLWADFGTNTKTLTNCVAVQMWTLANIDVNEHVRTLYDELLKGTVDLVLFAHSIELNTFSVSTKVNRQHEVDTWWKLNELYVAEMFRTNRNLCAAYCAVRADDGVMCLCLVVRCKIFLGLGEMAYPLQFQGIEVVLIEGTCAQITNPHPMSFMPPHAPGFVGASFGSTRAVGTLGAILKIETDLLALTAAHCLEAMDGNGLYCPCPRDFIAAGSLLHVHGEPMLGEIHLADGMEVSLDVAVLSAAEGQFNARTNVARKKDCHFVQDGDFLTLQDTLEKRDKLRLVVFGRTCGAKFGVQLPENVSMVHVQTNANGLNDVTLKRLYRNQFLIQSKKVQAPVTKGDSGSVCWVENEDHSLTAMGLVVVEVLQGGV
jgi:hypothetical protein